MWGWWLQGHLGPACVGLKGPSRLVCLRGTGGSGEREGGGGGSRRISSFIHSFWFKAAVTATSCSPQTKAFSTPRHTKQMPRTHFTVTVVHCRRSHLQSPCLSSVAVWTLPVQASHNFHTISHPDDTADPVRSLPVHTRWKCGHHQCRHPLGSRCISLLPLRAGGRGHKVSAL